MGRFSMILPWQRVSTSSRLRYGDSHRGWKFVVIKDNIKHLA